MNEPPLTKFHPTKAWRKRQKLGTLLNHIMDDMECLDMSFERKLFDRDNFEFALHQAFESLAKLNAYYWKNK